MVAEEITKVQTEQIRLNKLIASYERLRTFLERLGLDPESNYSCGTDVVQRELKRVQRAGADEMLSDVRALERKLKGFRESLEETMKTAAAEAE